MLDAKLRMGNHETSLSITQGVGPDFVRVQKKVDEFLFGF